MTTSDADRVEFLVARLQTIDALAVQLHTTITEAVGDLDLLNKAAYGEGGKPHAARLGGALSIDALFALVRGRLNGLGLEPLLQRTTEKTDPGWVDATASRLRRVVV